MADVEPKPGQGKSPAALGIPTATAKAEKRAISATAGKSAHSLDGKGRFAGLKTFLWVAPLTALIWIYAEREQIKPDVVRVEIRLVPQSSDRIITVLDPPDRYVSLDIQGPSASLTEIRDALVKPLEVNVSPEIGYKGDIPIIEAINRSDLFKTHAVEVKAARPAMNIKVEAKVARQVKVEPRPQDKLVGPPPQFEPEFVVIEGPKDVLEKIKPEDLVARADLSGFTRKLPGSYVQDVAIALPVFVEQVTLPATVKAKVTIAPSQNQPIGAIPILLKVSGFVLKDDKFRITIPETLPGVDVTGPPDAIEKLKKKEFRAAVVVDLTDEKFVDFATLPATWEKAYPVKATDYVMPDGVTVLNPGKEIPVSISRRN